MQAMEQATQTPVRRHSPSESGNIGTDTESRIQNAVLELFSQQEFHRVKLIDVATEAQISLQTIYKYYGSKENLLFSSLDRWLDDLSARMTDHLQGIENYKDRLRKVFWVILKYFEDNPRVAMIIMSTTYLNTWRRHDTFRQPELMSLFLRVLAEGKQQGLFIEELDEKDILDVILGFATRKVTMWLIRDGNEALSDRAGVLFEVIWRGVAKQDQLSG